MTHHETVTRQEAAKEVELVCRRLALLHIAYARTLVDKLGHTLGKAAIVEAIRRYGEAIGEEVRQKVIAQGLDLVPENYGAGDARQLPRFGMHDSLEWVSHDDGRKELHAVGCVMGKVWNEMDENELGRLYCLVDPAQFLAFGGTHTLAHRMTMPDGDPSCRFCIREASAQELAAFKSGDPRWVTSDVCSPEDG